MLGQNKIVCLEQPPGSRLIEIPPLISILLWRFLFLLILITRQLNFKFEKKKFSPSLLGLETSWRQFQTNFFLRLALLGRIFSCLSFQTKVHLIDFIISCTQWILLHGHKYTYYQIFSLNWLIVQLNISNNKKYL